MGRIMMNGIQYGTGARPTAEGVTYDNAESGMTAKNVQGALDELSNGLRTFTPVSAVSDRVTGLSGGYAYLNDHTVLVQISGTININVNNAYEFAAIIGLPSPMLDVSIAMSVLSVGSLNGFSSNARVGIDGAITFSLSKPSNNVYGKTFCLGGIYYVE